MIATLTGTLTLKAPPQVVLNVQGVGYEVEVPMSTFYGLPETGNAVTLRTHLVVKEDGHFLYGFLTAEEKSASRQLLKISGVGARTALGILSGLSVDELAAAVEAQDLSRMVKIPGIGKKTAERLLLELKGKMHSTLVAPDLAARTDILNALQALGYNEKEIAVAMRGLEPKVTTSEGIRQALKTLSGVK